MARRWPRDVARERTTRSRKRWSWARRVRGVAGMMDIITGESPRGAQRAGNLNDPEDAAVADRNLGNVSVRSWAQHARRPVVLTTPCPGACATRAIGRTRQSP
jgi:hypothetical protein